MTKTGTAAFVGLAVLLNAVTLAQEGRKITGVVESASTNQPVVNAQVRYDQIGLEPQTTRTDSKGQFEIPNGTRGIVTVTAQDYATAKRSWPFRQGRELRFVLTSPSVVTGALTDAVTRQGIEGRVVVVVHSRFHHVSKGARARGAFQFVDLPDGPAIIYAYADGFAPHYGELTVEAGKQRDMQIGLLLEAVASGSVLNADDSPVAGAIVNVGYDESVSGADILAGLAGGHVVSSEEEGGFRIRGLVPDTAIALQAELDDRVSDIVTIRSIDPGFEQSGIVLRMQ